LDQFPDIPAHARFFQKNTPTISGAKLRFSFQLSYPKLFRNIRRAGGRHRRRSTAKPGHIFGRNYGDPVIQILPGTRPEFSLLRRQILCCGRKSGGRRIPFSPHWSPILEKKVPSCRKCRAIYSAKFSNPGPQSSSKKKKLFLDAPKLHRATV